MDNLGSQNKVLLMGILNVTPDSFSDGGQFNTVDAAVSRAFEMIEDGSDIIDVGGESSGPGSKEVFLEEELGRVIPVIEAIRDENQTILISVDTYKAEVARRSIEEGADIINDVTACRGDDQMVHLIAETGVPIVVMYSKDSSARTMRYDKEYSDVVDTIKKFFDERVKYLKANGVLDNQIILDPGMGAFVSSVSKYSFEIVDRLGEFSSFGYPILLGPSRKSFLGGNLEDRLEASVKIAIKAAENGAHILRMHDVKEAKVAMNLALD